MRFGSSAPRAVRNSHDAMMLKLSGYAYIICIHSLICMYIYIYISTYIYIYTCMYISSDSCGLGCCGMDL